MASSPHWKATIVLYQNRAYCQIFLRMRSMQSTLNMESRMIIAVCHQNSFPRR